MDKDRLEGGVEGVAEPLGRKGKEVEGGTWQVLSGQGTHQGKGCIRGGRNGKLGMFAVQDQYPHIPSPF